MHSYCLISGNTVLVINAMYLFANDLTVGMMAC